MAATPKYHHGFEQYDHNTYGSTTYVNQSTLSRTGSYSFYADLDHTLGGVNSVSCQEYRTRYGDKRTLVCSFYIYVYAYPTGGDGKSSIFEWTQSAEANSFAGLALGSDGKISAWVGGNALTPTVVATSAISVPLEEWVRIDMGVSLNTISAQPLPNPPYESDATVVFAINRSVQGSWTAGTSSSIAGINSNNTSSFITGFPHIGLRTAYNTGVTFTATRGIVAFDDVVLGEGTSAADFLPTVLHTITVTGSAVGNYTGWGLTATTKEYVCNDASQANEGNILETEDSLASSSALEKFTVGLPTLMTKGVPINTRCYSPYVGIQCIGSSWSGRVILRVDGVDNFSSALTIGQNSYAVASFPTVAITTSSSIEIGVEKDNSATQRRIAHLFLGLCVEEVRAVPRGAAIEVVAGSYVGNGTAQEITTGIEADYMFVMSNAGGLSRYWTVSIKTPTGSPYYAMPMDDGYLLSERQFRYTATGFVPVGDAVNDSGVTYFVVAFKDPKFRMLRLAIGKRPGGGHPDYPNAVETFPWYRTPFTNTAPKYTMLLDPINTGGIAAYERYQFHTGDQAKVWAQIGDSFNDDTKQIVSVGATSVDIGQGAAGAFGSHAFLCFGLCDDVFVSNQLIVVGSYVGTGSGPRQVELPDSFNDKTPCLLWGCPSPTSGVSLAEYDFLWNEGMSAGASMKKASGLYNLANRGVQEVGAGYFTLYGSHYNEAGVTYNYVAIAEGVDEPGNHTPTPTNPPNPQCPWGEDDSPTCDPKYPEWPDDLPGLLGVIVGIRRYNAANVPTDCLTFKVPCEQRNFQVDYEERTFYVPYEERTFKATECN